jgi:hypothetical protein
VIIICLEKTVGKSSDTAQAIVLLILYAGIIAQSFKWPSFNYPRVSMWSTLSFIGVFWYILVNLLSWNVSNSIAWIIMLFVGWSILLTIGVTLQQVKFKSMLISRKHPDLQALFHFAYQCHDHAERLFASKKFIFRSMTIYAVPDSAEVSSEQLSNNQLLPSNSNLESN